MKISSQIVFVAALGIMASCSESNNANQNKESLSQTTTADSVKEEAASLLSLPAPMQIATAIKELKGTYFEKLLSPLPAKGTSETSTSKAFRLGFYAVDMGYATVFEHNQDAMKYFNESVLLANDLDLSSVANKSVAERYSNNKNNKDSLTYIALSVFNSMNDKLVSDHREDVGAEVFVGSFLEGLHLNCNIYKSTKSQELKRLLGEQKLYVDNINEYIAGFNLGKEAEEMVNGLKDLKKIYEGVTLKIDDNTHTYSEVAITDQQIDEISQKIIQLRKIVLGNNII